ncbi:MAG: hypothetical protein ACI4LX_10935 [Treponema sp.]
MKKIVGTIAAVALAAGIAFADVGIGSFARAIWAPVGYSVDSNGVGEHKSWEGVSWGGWPGASLSRVGITVSAQSENVGFVLDLNADPGNDKAGIGNAYAWVKPFDFLEVKIGKFNEDTGRGNVCYGAFDWLRFGNFGTGEDMTFARIKGGEGLAVVKVTPVKGLWAIGAFGVQDTESALTTFGNYSSYAAGYEIEGIGHIRAQYQGAKNAKDVEGTTIGNGVINAAFDLTAVDNLWVTVGAFIPLGLNAVDTDKDIGYAASNQITLAAGASYKLSAVTLHAYVRGKLPNTVTYSSENDILGVKFSTDSEVTKGGKVEAGIGADFDLGNGLTVIGDVRFQTSQDKTLSSTKKVAGTETKSYYCKSDETSSLDFMVGIQKALTNGSIGVGFEGGVTNFLDSKSSNFNWVIPVVISASF